MIYQTEAEANEACIEWQSRLRLADWIVKVKIVGLGEINKVLGEPAMGSIHPVPHRKEAIVRLLDPNDYPDDREAFPQDHEVTLVHELLHIFLEQVYQASPLSERTYNHKMAEEQVICSLSSSIVALKRKNDG